MIHALGITTRDLYPTRMVRILTRRVSEDHNVFSYLRFGLDSLAAAMSWSGWARVLNRLRSERRNDADDADDAGLMKFHTWNSERTTWTWLLKERPDGFESGFAKCYPALNQVGKIVATKGTPEREIGKSLSDAVRRQREACSPPRRRRGLRGLYLMRSAAHTNPKRERGSQPVFSLDSQARISPRRNVSGRVRLAAHRFDRRDAMTKMTKMTQGRRSFTRGSRLAVRLRSSDAMTKMTKMTQGR